ncbi:MAG TPA: hypothetical protein VK479_13350 [Micropepsaceae bacterium]|jgi:hypothetical protein|nr:hypothetical protein [Micropepsaceae bacterium]
MNPSPLSAFEVQNQSLVAPVRARLASLCKDPPQQARFLNMLSLLEHIGSRKIMASQAMTAAGHDILKHLAEEARHAFFFKRAAEKLARRPLDYSPANTMAGASARSYMDRLDAEIALALASAPPVLPYLYMSLIVELRAVWTYGLYQTVLTEEKAGVTLKSILAEEELHLCEMLARLKHRDSNVAARIVLFSEFEEVRFRSLWSRIEEDTLNPRLAAE